MIARAVNLAGLTAGLLIVFFAGGLALPHTAQGFALLAGGLVLVGGNLYWLLKRRKAERLAVLRGQHGR